MLLHEPAASGRVASLRTVTAHYLSLPSISLCHWLFFLLCFILFLVVSCLDLSELIPIHLWCYFILYSANLYAESRRPLLSQSIIFFFVSAWESLYLSSVCSSSQSDHFPELFHRPLCPWKLHSILGHHSLVPACLMSLFYCSPPRIVISGLLVVQAVFPSNVISYRYYLVYVLQYQKEISLSQDFLHEHV